MRNSKLYIVGFSADLILKFSSEIDIFIKHTKNWNFLHCSIDSPVQCCPEKAYLVVNDS